MSEAEQRYGLRIQEIESKLKALSEKVSGEMSEEISDLREGNMHFAWMKSDLQRVLEDFRNREIEGEVDNFVADLFGEEGGDAEAEEQDEIQFINIGKKEEPGTTFKAHWVEVSDSTSYSSCEEVVSKDIAETVFLEASQNKIANGVDISNGDLLFLMCRPEIPASDSQETQICTYIGLYLDTAGDQDQEPASETEVLITETLTTGEGEGVTAVASVFVWEECTCDGGDPDAKVNVPTVSTTESNSSSGYVISEKNSGSSSSFVELGDHTITPKVCLLTNPNSVSGNASSLSIKPVKDVTLNSSSIDLFATKCGTLSKEDSSSESLSSSVLAVSLGSSTEQINILDGLSSGAPISLGGTDIRAFIPLVSLGDAAKVSQSVESVAFSADPSTGLPIVSSSETENGVTTTTYTLHLVPQAHFSGITTQEESPFAFDIVTQSLYGSDPEVTGYDGSYTELEAVAITMETESFEDGDTTGVKHTFYKQDSTATLTYEKGRLKKRVQNPDSEKVKIGELIVPGVSVDDSTEDPGKTGTITELEEVRLSLATEAIPDINPHYEDATKYTIKRQYVTATNTFTKGRLTDFGNSVVQNPAVDILEFTVPGRKIEVENNGVSGSLSLLGSYDVTMDSFFVQKTNEAGEEYQEAVHRIYKTSVTRRNISWIDGLLTGLGTDLKMDRTLVGVIRVPEAPDAYKCEYGACVKDPSGEYTDNACDGQCEDPCVLSYRPSVLYVYVYNESKGCWELESEHERDDSPEVQNSFLTQHYSNVGRLDADCQNASDPSDPPVNFYVNNELVVQSDVKIIREEPLPYEQLCPDPTLPVYEKFVYQTGSEAYTETLDLEPELTTSPHDIIVEFCPGVIPDQLEIVGVGPFPGDTAVLLDTKVHTGVLSLNRTNSADYNHYIYSVTLPENTQQLQITVDHTQEELGDYTNNGWILGMYSAIEPRPFSFAALFNNEPHDFPGRIKWRHNYSCTACEKFELEHPYNPLADGFPGVHYFDTENFCNGSECAHP